MKRLFFSSFMIAMLFEATACQNNSGHVVTMAIFKDATCSDKVAGTLKLELGKACSNYQYDDSKGVTTKGSNGHFRCYRDKLIYDKYPFESDCPSTAKIIDKDHTVSASPQGCLRAPSHEGDVFERLLDYQYPGNETCGR